MRRSLRLLLWATAGFLLLVLAARWQATLSSVGRYLICSEAPQPADLILVLGGDFWGPRVVKAAELGATGYAPVVLISSPPYGSYPEGMLAISFLEAKGYRRDLFAIFPHFAHSTREEAIALRAELIRRRVRRVILVTSAYHSRRASIVFKSTCPHIQFISVPGPIPYYHPDRWWKDPDSRRILVSEWSKIIGTVALAPANWLRAW
jgi:uncharacterized SAM-binding protein YcdF (DUF218 family)